MGTSPDVLYREDLDRFTVWFKAVNARGPPVHQARAYKRLRKRVAMLREDRATPDALAVPAVRLAKWTAMKRNQGANVIVNGMLATRALKEAVVSVWGRAR